MTETPEPASRANPTPAVDDVSAYSIQRYCDTGAHALAALLNASGTHARHADPSAVVETSRVIVHFTPTGIDISFRDPHADDGQKVHLVLRGEYTYGALRMVVVGLQAQHLREHLELYRERDRERSTKHPNG